MPKPDASVNSSREVDATVLGDCIIAWPFYAGTNVIHCCMPARASLLRVMLWDGLFTVHERLMRRLRNVRAGLMTLHGKDSVPIKERSLRLVHFFLPTHPLSMVIRLASLSSESRMSWCTVSTSILRLD